MRQKSLNDSKRNVVENNKDGHARGVSWGTVTRIELDYSVDPETASNTSANKPKLDRTAVSFPVAMFKNHYSAPTPQAILKKRGRKVRMQLKPHRSEGSNRHKTNKDKDKDFLGGFGRVLLYDNIYLLLIV